MSRHPASVFLLITTFACLGAAFGAATTADDVLHYLDRTIDWYRQVQSLDQSTGDAEEMVVRETVRRASRQIVHLGFEFARGEAAILASAAPPTTASAAPGSRAQNLAQAATTTAEHLAQLQTRITAMNEQIRTAPPASQPTLMASRERLESELNFTQARHDSLQQLAGFIGGVGGGDATALSNKIDDLEKSVPETATDPDKSSSTPAANATSQSAFTTESAGLVSLVSEMFTLTHRISELHTLSDQTTALIKHNDELHQPIRGELQEAIHRGDAISNEPESDEPAKLQAQRQELDSLAVRFKLLAAATVPLGEQNALLDATNHNIAEWHAAVTRQYNRVLRTLLLHLGVTAAALVLLLVISRIGRRAIFRYVSEPRRRRQFLLLRRIVLGVLIVMVLVGSFVTEIGSLATFAGLITAGIAVALQTVILSGVAYFFFIGRYAVRVGDRVTVSGVTGDVVEIGLFRLYLMEVSGSALDPHYTGRIVVFSNAVLFQPAAFFKQIPGAEYVWHEVALTLAPETNYALAESRLSAAVQSVFEGYREKLDAQHATVKDSLHLTLSPPRPETRLRFVIAGLEVVVRYPVEIRRASEIDDQMTRKLIAAIDSEPELKRVATTPPKIQPAA